MKSLFTCLLLFSIFVHGETPQSTTTAQQKQLKNIEDRLRELERTRAEYDQWYAEFYLQSKGRVSPFLGEKILFGGFYETAITHLAGPNTPSQTSANSNLLGLNLAADFTEEVRFVSQFVTGFNYTFQNPHNNPSLTPSERQFGAPSIGSLVAQAYIELREQEALNIQTGLGYVPFGHAFQQREPVLFRRRGGPQMVNASDGVSAGIAFPLWLGVHVHGSKTFKESRIGYNVYSFTPPSRATTLGGGTRFWWSNSKYLTAGVSLQTSEQLNGSYYSYGVDVDFKRNDLGFIIEYSRCVVSGGAPANVSYYVEPYYDVADGKWLFFITADYIDNPNRTVGAVHDPHEKWLYGGGVNWLPITNARFRLGVFSHDYIGDTALMGGHERDYWNIDLSAGLAF